MKDLELVLQEALTDIQHIKHLQDLEDYRLRYLGKNSVICEYMKLFVQLNPAERKDLGQKINKIKNNITSFIEKKVAYFEDEELRLKLQAQKIDLTMPIRPKLEGRIHPISQVIDEVKAIFARMGFITTCGPDIEDDFHNFEALNIPKDHPARQMHDTFYLNSSIQTSLLRTHTTCADIRVMKSLNPPLRVISIGRVYRCDSDMTHTPMFHQLDLLCVEKNVHMGHLKGCIVNFLKTFFETEDVPIRFRPSYFPFTEPSAECDIGCVRKGEEIKIGPGQDWLEILGSGMLHPNVLRNVGLDPNEYQGFAFGMGIERIAMLKYGIADLRKFFASDIRWLKHYGFNSLDIPSLVEGLTE